jgi:hypothetical protein
MSKHFKLLIFDHSRKASHLFETKINAYFCASQKTQKICKKLKEAFNLFFSILQMITSQIIYQFPVCLDSLIKS